MSSRALHVIIKGHVQGVGYRNWTLTKARALGINGWVRNKADGSVEAVFSAEAEKIAAMLQACRQGPLLADVETIDTEWIDLTVEAGFIIK